MDVLPTIAILLIGVAVLDMSIGAVFANRRLIPPFLGLVVLLAGVAQGVVGAVLGLVAWRLGGPEWSRFLVVGFLPAVALVGLALVRGRGAPLINDIVTDTSSPPRFLRVAGDALLEDGGPDWPEAFRKAHRRAYGDLGPLRLYLDPPKALEAAERALERCGMEVVARHKATGRVQAFEESRLFRFRDDIVLEVRPREGGGSVIHARSRSRNGRGDLGVNAARIRRVFEAIRPS